jgi:cobalt-precorrin 5A hydrolase
VYIVSLGAVVRLIAPHLAGKEQDPGIVVLDEAGRFAIPVLSGHRGGGNALATHLAQAMGLTPVLTTASDVRGTITVDILGRELGWRLEAPKDSVTRACAAVVNDEVVAFVQEAGSRAWWPPETPLPANIHLFERIEDANPDDYASMLWVSRRSLPASPALAGKLVAYRPPRVALGIGCDRGTPLDTLQQALAEALALAGAAVGDVAAAASIDLKRDEPGMCALAEIHGWRVTFYPAAELAAVAFPHPSETVRRHTGTPSVAEAAALLSAGADMAYLIVEKHKLRGADGRNATISIARLNP